MAAEAPPSSGGGEATDHTGAQIATSPVTRFTMSTNAGPDTRRFCIQLYAMGRSDTAQDHNLFADFVTENLRRLGPDWAITAEQPSASPRAQKNIFLVQARAEFRGSGGCTNDHAENLAAMLRGVELHLFPQDRRSKCLFLRLHEIGQLGEHNDKLIMARLLDGLVAHGRREGDIFARGKRSKVDIIIEVAYTVTSISITVFGAVQALKSFQKPKQRQQARSKQTNAGMGSWPPPVDTAPPRTDWGRHMKEFAEAFANAASTPPWARGKVRTIAQARCDLLASLTQLNTAFDVAKGWVRTWLARGKATDTEQQLSTEEAIQFAQLIGSLSRSADDTAAVVDVLAPLLDERYILPKTANTSSAVAGAVVAAAVAFLWWNPVGWAAGVLGTVASFVAAHGTASAVAIGAGSMTAAVCGVKGKIGRDQRKLMDEVHTSKVKYQAQKNEVLCTLVLTLAEEQFQHLGYQDQKNICDSMGIQISLLGKKEFKAGVFKTAWEELERDHHSYCSSLRAAAVVIE